MGHHGQTSERSRAALRLHAGRGTWTRLSAQREWPLLQTPVRWVFSFAPVVVVVHLPRGLICLVTRCQILVALKHWYHTRSLLWTKLQVHYSLFISFRFIRQFHVLTVLERIARRKQGSSSLSLSFVSVFGSRGCHEMERHFPTNHMRGQLRRRQHRSPFLSQYVSVTLLRTNRQLITLAVVDEKMSLTVQDCVYYLHFSLLLSL